MRSRLLRVALAGAVLAALLGRLARRHLYRVEVRGASMRPALEPGDWLLLRRGAPSPDLLASGEAFGLVVAARSPGGRLLLKRLIGLPGESLRAGAAVQVNGRELDEPYASGEAPPSSYRGVSRLGPDSLFLLGDRRDRSTDSREFGPLEAAAVEGIVLARYWPPRRIGRLHRPARRWSATGSTAGNAAAGSRAGPPRGAAAPVPPLARGSRIRYNR
ncbi:MAG: signal peptidase I [Chloroflexi bacterium]|nr:signal peptidase I [Chloroflexota bacterium]